MFIIEYISHYWLDEPSLNVWNHN